MRIVRRHDRSNRLFERARRVIPGGVNSPARAFRAVGRDPVFIERAESCYMRDVDGNDYIDYVGSWGPLLLGHSHPDVVDAVASTASRGTSYGAPTEAEIEVAELIADAVPSIDMVRFVNSGTEATMSALRVARGHTGRDLVVKFIGNYHGHVDSLLVKAGSGLATLGISDSAGVPEGFAKTTLPLAYNDVAALDRAFSERGDRIAAVILEPVVGNMGCVPPVEGFLSRARELCTEHGAVLIFDEVMTGFRVAFGGAQQLYGVTPDMTTLGKVIGGGLPVGAFGGRREIMGCVAPVGSVYQAGTLSGNPVAVAAGLATLRLLKENPKVYDKIESAGARLQAGVLAAAREAGVTITSHRVGSMLTFFFTDREIRDWEDAATCDTTLFGRYFRAMLERGVYLPCSQYEAMFVGALHSDAAIDQTVGCAADAFREIARRSPA